MRTERRCGSGPSSRATRAVNSRNSSSRKAKPSSPVDQQRDLGPFLIALRNGQSRHAARETGGEQTGGLQGDIAQVEDLAASRAIGRGRREHGIRREQRREQNDIGEEEDPESVADDDPLRGRATAAVPARSRAMVAAMLVAEMIRIGQGCSAELLLR